jgi:hypothetical protein
VLGLNKNKKKEYGNNRKKLEGVKEKFLQQANISHATSHSLQQEKKPTNSTKEKH